MVSEVAKNIAEQFGNKPEDVYEEQMADANAIGDMLDVPAEDMPVEDMAIPEEEQAGEEMDAEDDVDKIKTDLQAIADDEEADKADKKQAEELIARLDELGAAIQNAKDFVAEKAPVEEEVPAEEAPAEEMPVEEEVPAEVPEA